MHHEVCAYAKVFQVSWLILFILVDDCVANDAYDDDHYDCMGHGSNIKEWIKDYDQ